MLTRQTLALAIVVFIASCHVSAQPSPTPPSASQEGMAVPPPTIDPGIVKTPPQGVDSEALQAPPAGVDPGMVKRPPADENHGAGEPSSGNGMPDGGGSGGKADPAMPRQD